MSDLLELVRDCEKASDIVEDMVKIKAMGDKAKRLYDLGLVKVAQGIMDEADQKYRMKRVAEGGYIRITDAKILAFLKRKAEEYNKGRTKSESGPFDGFSLEGVRRTLTELSFREARRQVEEQRMNQEFNRHLTSGLGGMIGGQLGHREYGQYIRVPVQNSVDFYNLNLSQYDDYIQAPPDPAHWAGGTMEANTVDSRSTAPGTIGKFRWVEVPLSQYAGIPPEPVLARLAEEKVKGIFQEYHVASVENIHDPLLLGIVKGCADRWYLSQWGNDVSLDDVI